MTKAMKTIRIDQTLYNEIADYKREVEQKTGKISITSTIYLWANTHQKIEKPVIIIQKNATKKIVGLAAVKLETDLQKIIGFQGITIEALLA